MIRVTVEMRYSINRQCEAVAWFVCGETPREWLEELTRWSVSLAPLRLWVMPRSAADRTPCGVLVTGATHRQGSGLQISVLAPQLTPNLNRDNGGYRKQPLHVGPKLKFEDLTPNNGTAARDGASISYGCVAGKLFVPVEATFLPQLDDADWRELLPSDGEQHEKSICVWHPTAGFVVFEPSQGLRVADLLQAPPRSPADWNHARPGVVFNSKLAAVVPMTTPTVESLLEQGRGDIGSRGDEWSELPQREGEPSSNPLAKLGSHAVLGAAAVGQAVAGAIGAAAAAIGKGLQALIGGPASAVSGSDGRHEVRPARAAWSVAIEQAMQRMLERMRQSLEPARQKALRRLMELLKNNPDEGLKYALPFGGEQHRGSARPSDHLAERPVNFDLKQLGGGGPADQWDMSAEMSVRLMARYRELANREMQLGRYRRAAYIFGHLLNDLPAAANVLVAGKHWREAALLYRDKLQQPLEAARCLEQGGLLTEAIVLYVEQKQFEKAGDLYARLEQPDEASRAWKQAVLQHEQANDYLAAAKLSDTKLANPEGALELVDAGWSRSLQADGCLAEAFRLLARMGRHSEVSQRITRWRDAQDNLTAARSPLLVQQLATITATYPDEEVRHLASDSARVLTARHWERCNAGERERLLKSITALVPEDRLLARDTRRFLTRPTPHAQKQLPSPKPTLNPKQSLRLIREWTLPSDVDWLTAASSRRFWFVIGRRGRFPVLVRGDWEQTLPASVLTLPNFGEPKGDSLLLSVAAEDNGPLVVRHQCGLQKTVHRWQPDARGLTLDRPPAWLHKHTVALCRQPGIVWVLSDQGACFVIEGYDEQSGLLLHSQTVNHTMDPRPQVWPTPFLVDTLGRKYIAEGEVLHLPHYDGVRTSDRGMIQSLAGMTFERVTRLVMTFESGGEVLWDDGKRTNSARLSDDYSHPVAAFTRRGHLVVADRSICEVFNADGHELRFRARGLQPTARPLAMLPAPHLDQFALVTTDGQVRLFEVPRP